jgi:ABC-type glycerol-3-phosphate transport system substrate-binding protein
VIARTCFVAVLAAACGREPVQATPIRFLHTFGPEETELFNAAMIERGIVVESSLVPFARGQQVIGEILRARSDHRRDARPCPDLIRIDATWLPGLAADLAPAPADRVASDWLPEAAELARYGGATLAVPQSLDGLVVLRPAARPAPASPSLADLAAAARAAVDAAHPHPLGLRADGYWFAPWLRAEGGELAVDGLGDDSISDDRDARVDGAARALTAFAALFGALAAPPPAAGSEAPDEQRRWNAGELAYWVTGPWQYGALADRDAVAVSALAGAPRGGQLLVVPRCAEHPDAGWRLADEIASVRFGAQLAAQFGTVPTRAAALAAAPPLVQATYAALRDARPLPRVPQTPLLFDDLNPALAAVVAGDATVDEALAGVRRGWARIGAAR